jgi:hypothetical protein
LEDGLHFFKGHIGIPRNLIILLWLRSLKTLEI